MQVLNNQKIMAVGGGNGIDAGEWAVLQMIMELRDGASSWGVYCGHVAMYNRCRAAYMAD